MAFLSSHVLLQVTFLQDDPAPEQFPKTRDSQF